MCFLDGGAFLGEAIESVLAQDFTDWELILVDDGSYDASTAIAKRHAAPGGGRITYLEHEGHANRGISASRNLGIAHARGELVAFLDADDVWVARKLAEQVAIMRGEPRADLLFGDTRWWHGWTGRQADRARDEERPVPCEANVVHPPRALLRAWPIGGVLTPSMSSVIVHAQALRAIGGFEEDFAGLCEDLAFMAKVFAKLHVYRGAACWDWYRQHERSCCARADRDGEYDASHRRLYSWMRQYFRSEKIEDRELLRALDRKLLRFSIPRWARFARRLLPA